MIPNSSEAASAMLSLAGLATGLLAPGGAFAQGLAVGVGVNAGALGVVLGGVQLGNAIDQYRDAMAGYDSAAQQAAYENLADATCGVVAGIGGTIAAVPGLQALGLGIWLGASLAQQYTNGNFGRLLDFGLTLGGWNSGFGSAEQTTSPLVLDLNGDGVQTTRLSESFTQGVHFNLDATGLAENTAWVSQEDGLLVRDLDADGKITTGRELFGNHTVLKNGRNAANGFDALAELDGNGDGVVNTNDASFASLKVWKDTNSDGVTDAGELLTLAQAGVKGFNVAYTSSDSTDANDGDAVFAQSSSFTRSNSTTGTTGETNGAAGLDWCIAANDAHFLMHA